MGAASCARSIFGVVLPFAAKPMYGTLGVAWACSLLGFLSLLMSAIRKYLTVGYMSHNRTSMSSDIVSS